MTLDELRRHLDDLDRRLLELIAERQRTGREIARVKRSTGRGTRDYGRERDVILAARANAARVDVPPDTAEEIMRLLIRTSLTTQEQASVAALGSGAGQRVLVIGGAGKIGGWFVQFLASQGFDVEMADPAPVAGRPASHHRLAQLRPQPRFHRRRHAAGRDQPDPGGAGDAPSARRDLRRRLAEVAAACRARRAARRRPQGHVPAPDVRPQHRAALRAPRDLHRPRQRGSAGRRARAVRSRPWPSRW